MIFAYKLDSLNTNLNPTIHKPDYISQTGTEGTYKVSGLPAGTFRLYAVKDEFRNLLFNAEQDRIGIPVTDVTLAENDTLYSDLDFYLSTVDSIKPRIVSVAMTDKSHLLMTFSEDIDSTYIKNDNFFIYDSTAKQKLPVLFAYQNNSKLIEAVAVIKDSLVFTNENFIFADTLKDMFGNYALVGGLVLR